MYTCSRNGGVPVSLITICCVDTCCSQITTGFLKQLVDKVRSDSQGLDGGEQVSQHFENTLAHIRRLQSSEDSDMYNDMTL